MTPQRRKSNRVIRPVWWVLVVVLATFAVWQRYTVVRLGADVEQLQEEITRLHRVRENLLAETTFLSSRDRIEAIAVKKLGLSPTGKTQRRDLPGRASSLVSTKDDTYAIQPTP